MNKHTQHLYADVIIPLPLPQLYTYQVPEEHARNVQAGCRVVVSFGKQKTITAIVQRLHHQAPEHYRAKPILEVLDDTPTLNDLQLSLFAWMADYYMCTPGEVIQAALPSALKINTQSFISLVPGIDIEAHTLSEEERRIVALIQKHEALQYEELSRKVRNSRLYGLLKQLQDRGLIDIFEKTKERYTPKRQRKVRLAAQWLHDKNALNELLSSLEKQAPQQWYALLKYIEASGILRDWTRNESGVEKKSLYATDARIKEAAIQALIKKGIFEEFEVEVSRFAAVDADKLLPPPTLSPAQEKALQQIVKAFFEEKKDIALLHGVTGSGKTEIYIHLIQQALESGSQVLYLLPEIALTTQIVQRLRKIFGDKMGVYHSRFSDNERAEVWRGVQSGRFSFVVGVRSAVFLPFDNLSLIIVDEEHEASYKQHEPAPRYHARDVAMMLGKLHYAKVLLGSATPALETYYHAQQGRYGYIALQERYGNAQLPQVHISDLRTAQKKNRLQYSFTPELYEAIRKRLEAQEQVILFQNRRGYSPYLYCEDCGWIPKCRFCNVSLTYHMHERALRCHYCGHHQGAKGTCQACGSTRVRNVGIGTEKIEDELKLLFPEARVARMDLDTTRGKEAYQKLIDRFEAHDIDILVGTQMLTKGLDFEKVTLVGVIDADQLLYFPDFRAHERAYQLLTQVSGRAGRKDSKGEVIIQSRHPEHPVLLDVQQQTYEQLVTRELQERQKYNYPPFVRLIGLQVKHSKEEVAHAAAHDLVEQLQKQLGKARILGPDIPLVDRVKNYYLRNILVKIERQGIHLGSVKKYIAHCIQQLTLQKDYRRLLVVVDVDPA
ncbi:primosomal protein N' (replication factor Y) [Thermonema lapsum]|uniref:Replication restart protein PriA n=1 Tax=Thermonema lapsum TaxID=28195 RepID=A0A846MP00_9BACT|nr:primosomal protein N' [Thermonema lapsum]NIK73181.1 primosomal protein N' (replication factor Y) [Thermonema lapsum]